MFFYNFLDAKLFTVAQPGFCHFTNRCNFRRKMLTLPNILPEETWVQRKACLTLNTPGMKKMILLQASIIQAYKCQMQTHMNLLRELWLESQQHKTRRMIQDPQNQILIGNVLAFFSTGSSMHFFSVF